MATKTLNLPTASLSPKNGFHRNRHKEGLFENDINKAMKLGYFHQLRYLAQSKLNLDVRDEYARTPLMNCSFLEDEQWAVTLARILLEGGASLLLKDNNGINAVHYACLYGKPILLDVFLRSAYFDINEADNRGNTVLHFAVTGGNITVTSKILDYFKERNLSINRVNSSGKTALQLATQLRRKNCVRLIREQPKRSTPETINQMPEPSSIRPSSPRLDVVTLPILKKPKVPKARPSVTGVTAIEMDIARILHTRPSLLRPIKSASSKSRHNNPESLLETTPIAYFTKYETVQETEEEPAQPTLKVSKTPKIRLGPNENWRIRMACLLNDFAYQLGSSYRQPFKYPPERPTISPMSSQSKDSVNTICDDRVISKAGGSISSKSRQKKSVSSKSLISPKTTLSINSDTGHSKGKSPKQKGAKRKKKLSPNIAKL